MHRGALANGFPDQVKINFGLQTVVGLGPPFLLVRLPDRNLMPPQ
jgi:hypothetical protein